VCLTRHAGGLATRPKAGAARRTAAVAAAPTASPRRADRSADCRADCPPPPPRTSAPVVHAPPAQGAAPGPSGAARTGPPLAAPLPQGRSARALAAWGSRASAKPPRGPAGRCRGVPRPLQRARRCAVACYDGVHARGHCGIIACAFPIRGQFITPTRPIYHSCRSRLLLLLFR